MWSLEKFWLVVDMNNLALSQKTGLNWEKNKIYNELLLNIIWWTGILSDNELSLSELIFKDSIKYNITDLKSLFFLKIGDKDVNQRKILDYLNTIHLIWNVDLSLKALIEIADRVRDIEEYNKLAYNKFVDVMLTRTDLAKLFLEWKVIERDFYSEAVRELTPNLVDVVLVRYDNYLWLIIDCNFMENWKIVWKSLIIKNNDAYIFSTHKTSMDVFYRILWETILDEKYRLSNIIIQVNNVKISIDLTYDENTWYVIIWEKKVFQYNWNGKNNW